jgi:transcriptional regulator with PAS, ATPase and Fis domain
MDDLQFLQQNFATIENSNKFSDGSSGVFPGSSYVRLRESDLFMGMIVRSSKMQDLIQKIKKIATVDSTVFITGPSGAGKELASRAIHSLSVRKFKKFISVNCGAIPENLLESELFGHRRGSFTGAIKDKTGRFEAAHHGTLFLDEIGDMPLSLQVKLLRVMQNKIVEPVGSVEGIPIDVRIISATHRNLETLVQTGKFREDLFYRLNVIPLPIPSLAQRPEDIIPLIDLFIHKLNKNNLEGKISFSHNALECLLAYEWPGNIRELENLIERLSILKGGSKIDLEDLPTKIVQSKTNSQEQSELGQHSPVISIKGIDMKAHILSIEKDLICQALRLTNGNKNQAAKLLNLNRTTLIEKMKKKRIYIENITID